MSGGKKRSGFQITSVTSDFNNQTPAGQSAPSVFLSAVQSAACPQGSSSQPSTPSLKRKYISQDAAVQGAGTSRFRVVRLAGGAGGAGWGESFRRGRWTCMDLMERGAGLQQGAGLQLGAGFRRVMDSMRHAHSLESLEMIGRDKDRGGVYSHDGEGGGIVLHSGPPSPTHQQPITIRLLDHNDPMGVKGLDSTPPPPSPRPRNIPPPLRLDVDAAGRSVLRLSHSQPSSPPAGPYHPSLTPIQTPGAFSLDQTIFHLPGDASSSNSLVAIDNKIEQAMDLVKSHLMLAVREEVELLREQIRDLQDKNQQLERENQILRALTHSHPPVRGHAHNT
ncbi:TSC22 domain family protein 4 isoform X2 [Scomber japonicus]|uniref:TSC22 domain family protein 4 isoform X2 n=1 Tax=Scomber japonicus TaxID=13676 RepID=UPI00230690E2|nr:TSC22 domain family protein 4 isoform X2 [Scomber japonicus]